MSQTVIKTEPVLVGKSSLVEPFKILTRLVSSPIYQLGSKDRFSKQGQLHNYQHASASIPKSRRSFRPGIFLEDLSSGQSLKYSLNILLKLMKGTEISIQKLVSGNISQHPKCQFPSYILATGILAWLETYSIVANLPWDCQKKLMWSSGLLPGCIWAAAHNDMYNCKGLPKKAGWI